MNALFIRGLTRENRHWNGLEERYQKENPDINVHAIDLPGAGIFFKLTSPAHLDDYIYFLREKLNAVKKDRKTILIGISMGGMIAIRWAELFPDEIEKIFVINSSARNLSTSIERFNVFEIKKLFGVLFSKNPYFKEKNVLKLTTEKFDITEEILKKFAEIQKSSPVSTKSAINQIWAASRFKINHQLKIPTVIISGLKDKLVSPKCSKALAETIGAKLVTHPNAGHDLPLDDPSWLLSELRL